MKRLFKGEAYRPYRLRYIRNHKNHISFTTNILQPILSKSCLTVLFDFR
ncbi:MAG: hypothetical protein LBJ00_01265 [Planctomycetaceae bacterium]|nr:hypothetical protein [Planctomycetaceae bacterium]